MWAHVTNLQPCPVIQRGTVRVLLTQSSQHQLFLSSLNHSGQSNRRRMAGKSSAPRRGRRKLSSAQVTAAATIIAAVIGGGFLLANTLLSTAPSTSSGPVPTASSLPAPSATGPLIPGDNSEFISDVTFPDHSTVVVGKHFIKKWKIKNTGSALWVGRYLAPIGTFNR